MKEVIRLACGQLDLSTLDIYSEATNLVGAAISVEGVSGSNNQTVIRREALRLGRY